MGSSASSKPFAITIQEGRVFPGSDLGVGALINRRAVRPATWRPYGIDQSVSIDMRHAQAVSSGVCAVGRVTTTGDMIYIYIFGVDKRPTFEALVGSTP